MTSLPFANVPIQLDMFAEDSAKSLDDKWDKYWRVSKEALFMEVILTHGRPPASFIGSGGWWWKARAILAKHYIPHGVYASGLQEYPQAYLGAEKLLLDWMDNFFNEDTENGST